MSVKTFVVTAGSDSPYSNDVKWYAGGVIATEQKTISAGDVSAGFISLAKKAEFGSVVGTVKGVPTLMTEKTAAGGGAATNSTDTSTVTYTGMKAGDVVILHYIDVETSEFKHIASCQDVSIPMSSETKAVAVQGQANKLQKVGALETTMSLEKISYDLAFIGMVCGNAFVDGSGNEKWTTMYTGFKKLGCVLGEETDAEGAVVRKWFVYGATCSGVTFDMPNEDFYKESMDFVVDAMIAMRIPPA